MPEIQMRQIESSTEYSIDGDIVGIRGDWSEWMTLYEYETVIQPFPSKMQFRLKPEESDE